MPTPLNKAVDQTTGVCYATGWHPSPPDMRDYTATQKDIIEASNALKMPAKGAPAAALPGEVDLRAFCSTPVKNQLGLGSCTANAAAGIVEYFEKRAFGKHLDGSRLFIYKNTRNLLGWKGDTGAYLRTTMAALRLFGVPQETYWPYTDKAPEFDLEPPAFVYSLGSNFKALNYFSHDPFNAKLQSDAVLLSVRTYLAAGIPSMFGFYGFDSFSYGDAPGAIPYPCPDEKAKWGHAIAAVGYNDKQTIINTRCNTKTVGALLIRNSWGTGWGDNGYGWLPYDYVLNYLASDFWSILSLDWVNTDAFKP